MSLTNLVFPQFLLTFRESLEVSLIVSIISAYLRKIGKADLNKYLIAGAGAAVVLSILLGWVIQAFYGTLTGVSLELFEGVGSLTATSVLTYMIFWMARNARNMRHEIEGKVDIAVSRGQLYSLSALAFVAVFREGVETVLFLTPFLHDPSGTAVGIIVAIGLVVTVAIVLLKGIYRLNARSFFKYSSILLLILAAGLAGYGVHELIEATESSGISLGPLSQPAFNINPSDTSDTFHERGTIGSVMRALVGYDGNPEWLRIIVYIAYWSVIGLYLTRQYRPGTTVQVPRF